MKDKYNRVIKHIRFSVTAKCNFNCIYCDKEGFVPKTNELTVDEIKKLCYLLSTILKVTKIKFTGGEPLCREAIVQIIEAVRDLNLYKDISLTTNGYFLYEKAQDIFNAGLNRINVSLCSLKPEVFKKITRTDNLDKVLKGLEKAKEVGLDPIKLNFVILKGINDDELEDMIEFCAKTGYILQLIELHKLSDAVGNKKAFYDKNHFDINPIIENLESRAIDTIIRGSMQNRKVFTLPNNAIVETINSGRELCSGCSKMRVGCDGNLFGCLYRSELGKNVKAELGCDYTLDKYAKIITDVVKLRQPYYT